MDDNSEPRVTEQSEAVDSGRPGCIAAYAILLAVGGIANIIVSGILGLNVIVDEPDLLVMGAILTLCLMAVSAIPVIIALGLWRMRLWAWWLVIIFQTVGLATTCFGLLAIVPLATPGPSAALGTAEVSLLLIGALASVLFSGIVLYWFLKNRKRFRRRGVIHVEGRALEEPASDRTLAIVAGTVIAVVAILCLVSIVVLVILTLLGPQIGNTFSQITSGLGTPLP